MCRALEIYEQTGQIRSSHLMLQHSASDQSAVSGKLRFSDICMIWVQCSQQGTVGHTEMSCCSSPYFFHFFGPYVGPRAARMDL